MRRRDYGLVVEETPTTGRAGGGAVTGRRTAQLAEERIEIVDMVVVTGISATPQITIEVRVGKDLRKTAVTGESPTAALLSALSELLGGMLAVYRVCTTGDPNNPMHGVSLNVSSDDENAWGEGAGHDLMIATAEAYADAVAKLARRFRNALR